MESLKQIISRAIEQGWNLFGWVVNEKDTDTHYKEGFESWRTIEITEKPNLIIENRFRGHLIMDAYSLSDIIFNHDFAKAIFGEEEKCPDCGESLYAEIWQGELSHYECPNNHNWDDCGGYTIHLPKLSLIESDQDRIAYIYKNGA